MPVLESLLTSSEVAKLCRVSVPTVKLWLRNGKTPAPVRLTRSIRFRASEIDLWIRLGCPNRSDFEAASASNRPEKM